MSDDFLKSQNPPCNLFSSSYFKRREILQRAFYLHNPGELFNTWKGQDQSETEKPLWTQIPDFTPYVDPEEESKRSYYANFYKSTTEVDYYVSQFTGEIQNVQMYTPSGFQQGFGAPRNAAGVNCKIITASIDLTQVMVIVNEKTFGNPDNREEEGLYVNQNGQDEYLLNKYYVAFVWNECTQQYEGTGVSAPANYNSKYERNFNDLGVPFQSLSHWRLGFGPCGPLGPMYFVSTCQDYAQGNRGLFAPEAPEQFEEQLFIASYVTSYIPINYDTFTRQQMKMSTNLFCSSLYLRVEILARSFLNFQAVNSSSAYTTYVKNLFSGSSIFSVLSTWFQENPKFLNVDFDSQCFGTYGVLSTGYTPPYDSGITLGNTPSQISSWMNDNQYQEFTAIGLALASKDYTQVIAYGATLLNLEGTDLTTFVYDFYAFSWNQCNNRYEGTRQRVYPVVSNPRNIFAGTVTLGPGPCGLAGPVEFTSTIAVRYYNGNDPNNLQGLSQRFVPVQPPLNLLDDLSNVETGVL